MQYHWKLAQDEAREYFPRYGCVDDYTRTWEMAEIETIMEGLVRAKRLKMNPVGDANIRWIRMMSPALTSMSNFEIALKVISFI